MNNSENENRLYMKARLTRRIIQGCRVLVC